MLNVEESNIIVNSNYCKRSKRIDMYYDLKEDNCKEYFNCVSENILNGYFSNLDKMLSNNDTNINSVIEEFETVICNSCIKFQKVKRKSKPIKYNEWFDVE